MIEEWRTVPGMPDVYEVSNSGQVRSWVARGRTGARATEPRTLPGTVTPKGYVRVLLGQAGRQKHHVHVLVARAFIGPRAAGQQVRHLDGNAANNAVSNLAYGTATDNAMDRIIHHADTASGPSASIRRAISRARVGEHYLSLDPGRALSEIHAAIEHLQEAACSIAATDH